MGKEQLAFHRQLLDLNFRQLSRDSIELDAGSQYRELLCRMSGTLNIATAAATAVKEDAPYSIIRNVEVMVNGNVPVKTLTGKALKELTARRLRVLPSYTAPGTGTGDHEIEAFFVIRFWMPDAGLAMDSTMLDVTREGGINTCNLSVDWGQASDLVTPDGTTVLSWTVEPTIEVVAHEVVGRGGAQYAVHRERTITMNVNQTTDRFVVDLFSGPNRKVLGATIFAREAGVLTDGIINTLAIESDRDNRWKQPAELARLVSDAKIERAKADARLGIYHIDLAPYMMIGHGAEMSEVSRFDALLDVTAGADSQLEIVVQEIIGAPGRL